MLPRKLSTLAVLLVAALAAAPQLFSLSWLPLIHGQDASPPKAKQTLDEKTIRALIKQLGDDSYEKREDAQKKLVAAGKAAIPLLRKAAAESNDAEVRERALSAAKAISAGPGPGRWSPGGSVFDIAYSKDGTRLAVASEDRMVRIYDAKTAALRMTLKGHTTTVYCAVFSSDGKTLASCSGAYRKSNDRGEIIFWDVATGKPKRTLQGPPTGLVWIVFSPDEKNLYSCGSDGSIRKWDIDKAKEIGSALGHKGSVRRVYFTPDGKLLASLGFDGTVRFWDPKTLLQVREITVHQSGAGSLAFSPDGKYLITCSRAGAPPIPGEIKVWDMATFTEKMSIKGHKSRVLSLAVSPDNKLLAMGGGEFSDSGEVMIFDLATGAVRARFYDHNEWVECVTFSPDGKWLASGCGWGPQSRGEVRLWDMKRLAAKGE